MIDDFEKKEKKTLHTAQAMATKKLNKKSLRNKKKQNDDDLFSLFIHWLRLGKNGIEKDEKKNTK